MAYNHEPYIGDAIEGFLKQKTNFDFEILIGEDCSTDNTRKIVEEYAEKFPDKIKMITSEKNVGWKENDRRLLENSKGKYIAVCEGDDYWIDPYKLQKQLDYMESHPECTLCFHASQIVDSNGRLQKGKFRPYLKNTISKTEDIIEGGGEFCPTASLFFSKDLLDKIPDFVLNAHVGDYPLQMWLSSIGYAYYLDDFMSIYRMGAAGSWTVQQNSGNDRVKKIVDTKMADIDLLNKFNEYSNFKYEKSIEKTIMKREFEILLAQNRIKEIKSSKYKVFFESMDYAQIIKVYTKYFFPKIYSKLVLFKSKVSNHAGKLKW